jgi:hypothetical protein
LFPVAKPKQEATVRGFSWQECQVADNLSVEQGADSARRESS